MILMLILQGRYTNDGKLFTHGNARRVVSFDLAKKDERDDLRKLKCENFEEGAWGLSAGEYWWRIDEAFELIEPTVEIHEGKYPVSYAVTASELDEIIEDAIRKEK